MASDSTDTVRVRLDENNEVVINKFGATVVSWVCGGKERLFVSSKAVFDNKKAIRGGIPVVFPNFGPWDLGPQHGFARISMWKCDSEIKEGADGHSVSFSLCNSADTEAMWNHKFLLEYTVLLGRSNTLKCTLSVTNTGESEFDFTTLLHTYIRVKDVNEAVVSNLQGLQYVDKLKGAQEFTENRELVSTANGADSVYKSTPHTHLISGCVNESKVEISKVNLPDTVVWNPWIENAKKMSDFGDEEYKEMICVEPGAVSQRVVIQSGESKTFSQTLQVKD